MGVISTGAIFKTLTFDGRSSSEFNVYITGEGVFNAPERAVEMISIPGRNGAFALDYGRFENIEVTYNCGIAGDDDADFADAVSAFRNWLCSRNGYVRLTDDYNAGEYRLAIYKSGLEVTAENLKAGEFPVVFECKPQRFLTSGETAVAVTSGDTITNPTLFNASPLLEVTGHGDINLGSAEIEVVSEDIGNIPIADSVTKYNVSSVTQTIESTKLAAGDTITVSGVKFVQMHKATPQSSISDITVTSTSNVSEIYVDWPDWWAINVTASDMTFAKGTSATFSATIAYTITVSGTNYSATLTCSIAYNGNDTLTLSMSDTSTSPNYSTPPKMISSPVLYAYSTKQTTGNPLYIDLDIGEAWNEDYGTPVSVNNAVTMPAELPTLTPGTNTITFDNTITGLDIVPRWWKI